MAGKSVRLVPQWAYRHSPGGLTDEFDAIYRVLKDPLWTIRNFGSDHARRAAAELLAAWHETLRKSEDAARAVLPSLHGRSQRTHDAGEAILDKVAHVTGAICSALRFLKHPHPTRKGTAATSDSLRNCIADLLDNFDSKPLLDELAAAVVSDCQKSRMSGTEQTTRSSLETSGSRLRIREGLLFLDGRIVDLDLTREKRDDVLAFLSCLIRRPGIWDKLERHQS